MPKRIAIAKTERSSKKRALSTSSKAAKARNTRAKVRSKAKARSTKAKTPSTKEKTPSTKIKAQSKKKSAVENSMKTSTKHVLSIDIGGSSVKMLVSGEIEPRKERSGRDLTPAKLLLIVQRMTRDWNFDYITIGYPGLVGPHGPIAEPGNLGSGWVSFDFSSAFAKPVKVLNDAAMQAIGSYEGGRMLFLGLGTGFGSTLIINNSILELELSNLRWDQNRSVGDILSKRSLRKIGVKKWRVAVEEIVEQLMRAMLVDYVVVGGGNAKLLKRLPAGARLGHNQTAFLGGYKVWELEEMQLPNFDKQNNPGPWNIL